MDLKRGGLFFVNMLWGRLFCPSCEVRHFLRLALAFCEKMGIGTGRIYQSRNGICCKMIGLE